MDRRRARLAILRDVHGSRKDDRKQDENDRIDQKRTVMLGPVNLIPLLAGRGTPKYHDHGTTGSLQSSLFIFLIQIHNGRSPRRLHTCAMSGEPLVAFPARLSAPVFVRRSPSRPPLTPAALASFLPSTPGALPYFFLLTSAASIYNAAQNYFILWQTKEIYSAKAHEGGSAPGPPTDMPMSLA